LFLFVLSLVFIVLIFLLIKSNFILQNKK